MNESHYWPTVPGTYQLERYQIGGPIHTFSFDGSLWTYGDDVEAATDTDQLIRDYCLGVRRETPRETQATNLPESTDAGAD